MPKFPGAPSSKEQREVAPWIFGDEASFEVRECPGLPTYAEVMSNPVLTAEEQIVGIDLPRALFTEAAISESAPVVA